MTDEIQTNGPSPEAVDLPSETDEITTTTGDRAIEIVEEDPTRTTIPVGLPEATDGLEKIRVRDGRVDRGRAPGPGRREHPDPDRPARGLRLRGDRDLRRGSRDRRRVRLDPDGRLRRPRSRCSPSTPTRRFADVEVYSEVFGLEESDEE
jgi:hypothetical protein